MVLGSVEDTRFGTTKDTLKPTSFSQPASLNWVGGHIPITKRNFPSNFLDNIICFIILKLDFDSPCPDHMYTAIRRTVTPLSLRNEGQMLQGSWKCASNLSIMPSGRGGNVKVVETTNHLPPWFPSSEFREGRAGLLITRIPLTPKASLHA